MKITESMRDRFYVWAFHMAYEAFRAQMCSWTRFARAIVLSSAPVSDERIEAWWRARKRLRALRRAYVEKDKRDKRALREYLEAASGCIMLELGRQVKWRAWEQDQMQHGDEAASREETEIEE